MLAEASAFESLGVEQDGDVVGSEWHVLARGAGAYDGLVVHARVDAGAPRGGKFRQVRSGVAHDEPGLARALGIAGGHAAGNAGGADGGLGRVDGQSGPVDEPGYSGLLLLEGEDLDGGGEVFDRVKLAVALDNGDADDVDVGSRRFSR